jgi:hypothetical protein
MENLKNLLLIRLVNVGIKAGINEKKFINIIHEIKDIISSELGI